jgi:hypothetical protein
MRLPLPWSLGLIRHALRGDRSHICRISAIFGIFPLFSDFFPVFLIFWDFFGKRTDHRRSTAMVFVRLGTEGSESCPNLRPNFKKEDKMAKSSEKHEPKSGLREFES